MLNSTSIDDLQPLVAVKVRRLIAAAGEQGLQLVIISTLRDAECQAKLYAMGRAAPGARANAQRPLGLSVTSNKPGESLHEYGCAIDCFPVLAGYLVSSTHPLVEWKAWLTLRKLAASPGINLQWGAGEPEPNCLRQHWHFHYSAGLTAAELAAGAQLPEVTLGEPALARPARRKHR